MKVAVLNFSGNVGKTTVAAHLLKPRMADAPIFSVESLNIDASADGIDVEKIRGSKYKELTDQLMNLDSAIIDVGHDLCGGFRVSDIVHHHGRSSRSKFARDTFADA